ncbi:MAG: hypothetical protein AAF657_12770 [Acidobacteriota bacterium]
MMPDVSTSRLAAISILLGLSLLAQTAIAGGGGTIECFDGEPAMPIEEFRTIGAQTFRMWSDFLEPTDPIGSSLPAARDSTGYSGFDRPGRAGGLEFFYGIDIQDNNLYMVYNAGWQIWNINGGLAVNPQVLSQRDGWDGDFHEFQEPVTELYFLLFDIDAIDPPGNNNTLVAVAGKSPVGPTIWDAANKSNPQQLYQDEGKSGVQVAAANIDGRSYAFFSHGQGVHVYDMTRAREIGPCFENTLTATSLCGGNSNPVWRGQLGPWPWGKVEYLDVLETVVGGETKHFIALTDGTAANSLGMELREITNISTVPPTSTAIRQGLNTFSFGVELFQIDDRYYTAVINFTDLEIYDITGCITGTGGCSFTGPEFDRPVAIATDLPSLSFVRFSESDGRPFLYKGFSASCSAPPAAGTPNKEWLLDLDGLRTGGPIVDVRGETYNDPNHNSPQRRIDYWSSYYDKSTEGYSAFAPHDGVFHGRFFYRASQSMFDIHEYTGGVEAEATIAPTSNDRWFSSPTVQEWVNLNGSCNIGSATGWQWTSSNAAGTPAADPAPVVEQLAGSTARVRRGLCAADNYPTSTCPNETLEVEADVTCGMTPVTSNEIDLTLSDPRPFFDQVDIVEPPADPGPPPQYPICQVVNFRALNGVANEIAGKALTTFNWQVRPTAGGDTLTCNAAGAGTGLNCTQTQLVWDTTDVELGDPDLIFADGFESGNTTAWGAGAFLDGGVASTFDVTLTATNEHGSIAQTTQLTITPLEALAFNGDGFTIPATPPLDGIYDFTATAENATDYRWEFEQDSSLPGDPDCQIITPCEVVMTTSPTVQYQWPAGNTNGADYDVAVEISNCDPGATPISRTRTVTNVTVITDMPPEVDEFRVVTVGTDCLCLAGICTCPPGSVSFTVDVTGECDDLDFVWGDGQVSNNQACDNATYVHNYTSTGTFNLEVTACRGALCDTQVNLTNISQANPVPLTIATSADLTAEQ